jgi:hypothetical protein
MGPHFCLVHTCAMEHLWWVGGYQPPLHPNGDGGSCAYERCVASSPDLTALQNCTSPVRRDLMAMILFGAIGLLVPSVSRLRNIGSGNAGPRWSGYVR